MNWNGVELLEASLAAMGAERHPQFEGTWRFTGLGAYILRVNILGPFSNRFPGDPNATYVARTREYALGSDYAVNGTNFTNPRECLEHIANTLAGVNHAKQAS